MTREEIFNGLKEVLAVVKPNIDQTSITEQSNLWTDLGIDSLSILLISLAIENKFNFKFEGVPPFQTVAEVVDYVITKA